MLTGSRGIRGDRRGWVDGIRVHLWRWKRGITSAAKRSKTSKLYGVRRQGQHEVGDAGGDEGLDVAADLVDRAEQHPVAGLLLQPARAVSTTTTRSEIDSVSSPSLSSAYELLISHEREGNA